MKLFKITLEPIVISVPSNMTTEEVKKQYMAQHNIKPANPITVEEIKDGIEVKNNDYRK